MLKKYAAETKGRVKDRMMLIIKIKRDGMGIREAAKSLACNVNVSDMIGFLTKHFLA